MLLNPLGMYSSGGTIEGGALEELKNFKEIYTELSVDSTSEPSNIKNVNLKTILDVQGSGIVLACFTNIVSASNVNIEFVIIKITIDGEIVLWACNSFYNGFAYSQGINVKFANQNNYLDIYGTSNLISANNAKVNWKTINDWDVTCTKSLEPVYTVLDLPIIFNDSLKVQTYSFCLGTSKQRKYEVYVRYKLDE